MKVRARIDLLASGEGGRALPVGGSFRPNHRFLAGHFTIGEVVQKPGEGIAPGESAERIVSFLLEGLPNLTVGMTWEIFEGPARLIGRGTVLEILGQ